MDTEVVAAKNAFVGGARGSIVVSVWDGVPNSQDGVAAVRLLAQAARTERSLLVVAILAAGTKPPPNDVRDALAGELARIGTKITGLANVVEGDGFRAAAVRGVLTGMSLIIRAPYPQRICVDVREAATFLSDKARGTPSAVEIEAAIASIRAQGG